jgi:hypothetical protein
MMIDLDLLKDDFFAAADQLGIDGWPCPLQCQKVGAPHRQAGLPAGFGAVYAYALSAGTTSAAGAGTVLKVGKAGPNSDARFRSQHYTTSAGSTLAKSLLKNRILWRWLGIEHLDETTVKAWMLTNLDRINIFVPAESPLVLNELEKYVRARIGSVFEGSA